MREQHYTMSSTLIVDVMVLLVTYSIRFMYIMFICLAIGPFIKVYDRTEYVLCSGSMFIVFIQIWSDYLLRCTFLFRYV